MKIDLRQLEMLEAVARHQSLTLAAKALHVTQPAISIQLRKLEDELGIALTERDGRGIRITDAGEEVLRHAQRIGRTIEDLCENIRQHRGLVQGHLRIAVVSTANYLITENIARFRKMYPGIKINLQVANRDGVLELVDRNESDLAVSGQPPDDSDLVARRFRPNPLVVIAPPDHPLAGRTNLTPQVSLYPN
ncbi:LysR family transcriptional regulator [Aquicoccus porphyridii]|uniref:LysR family transcriptional regulator n=1 Tax=Aquicoccus porphyridii TaxID=1852029 RepID=UPI0027402C0B|nr:LysR family transcriptional regulator [Aquicoccus porphyridii]